jgi:hypothetical protein
MTPGKNIMARKTLDKKEFNEIIEFAENAIKNGAKNDWISISNLMRRAYYWGLMNGLESISSKEDLNRLAGIMLKETMFSSDLDELILEAIEKRKKHA